MAHHEDTFLRPQMPEASSGRPRRKSGHSVAASSTHSHDNRPTQPQQTGCISDNCSRLSSPKAPSIEISIPSTFRTSRPAARTVPAWVRSTDEGSETNMSSRLLPSEPDDVRIAEHNNAPRSKQRPILDRPCYGPLHEPGARESRWKNFARPTAYPRSPHFGDQLVSKEWLDENFGDYSQPWQGYTQPGDLESGSQTIDFNQRRKLWMENFQKTILRSPIVPLIIRLTVFIFSLMALALGRSIRYYVAKFRRPQGPSAEMAIIVDAVALVYLVYITWDEYTGKPLGLRAAKAKMRLIFLDLFFIVFDSANLGLAFEALSDPTGSCAFMGLKRSVDHKNNTICMRQKALASVLLIALIAWLMTFAISVLRLVERVTQK